MEVYTLTIFFFMLLGLSSSWLDCPPGKTHKRFDHVVYYPRPRVETYEACVPDELNDDLSVSSTEQRYNGNNGESGLTTNHELQCPLGTIKRAYQYPVDPNIDPPQLCEPESLVITDQNPAILPIIPIAPLLIEYPHPLGQPSSEVNLLSRLIDSLQCPPGTIKKTYDLPDNDYTDIPQLYEVCDRQEVPNSPNTIKNPVVSPAREGRSEWNNQHSVESTEYEDTCPPGYIEVEVEEPDDHRGDVPEVVVKCYPEFQNNDDDASESLNGKPYK